MKSGNLVIVLAVITLAQSTLIKQINGQRSKSKCSSDRDLQFDVCSSRISFLGDRSFKVPKNDTSMSTFCSDLKSNLACIQTYTRDCLQGLTRQLLTGILRRGRQQYSSMCNDLASKSNFVSKMSCLTDEKIGSFHGLMEASVARFEYVASKVKPDSRLPAICCSYQIFNRDVDSTLDQICGKPSNVRGSTKEFIQRIVGGTAGEFFALICENHRSLEECKASQKTQLVVPKLEEITIKVNEGKLLPKNKSLVPVLLEILDSSETQ